MAVLDKKGESAAQKVAEMLETLKHKGADAFGIASSDNLEVKTSLEQLQTRDFKASAAVGHVLVKVLAEDKPQPITLEKAAMVFDGRIYQLQKLFDIDFVEGKFKTKREENAETLIRDFDGSFAFAIAEAERIIFGRDPMGLYPLYYGENENLFAVASECKALWKIGIEKTKSFPPGHIATANKKGVKIKPVRLLRGFPTAPATLEDGAEKLQSLLEQSFKERVLGLNEVAVAFSGGLDSSLTALLAEKAGVKVHLIHVSLENQLEVEQAKKAAAMLGLPLHLYLFSEKDLEQTLPEVLWSIENLDPIKTSIGVPFFWTAEKTAELGLKVLLAGQGADELFGGYMRYLNVYQRQGEAAAQRKISEDILKMHENNFERDTKICFFHNVELRLPFAARQLAEFALSLPLKLKIESKNDMLRKIVLRNAAEKMELPLQIARKPKKAIQYATGVNNAIKKLAKKNRLPLRDFLGKFVEK